MLSHSGFLVPVVGLDKIKERLGLALAGGAHSRRMKMGSSPAQINSRREAYASLLLLVPVVGLEPTRCCHQRI